MLSIFSKRHIKSSERIQAAHENKPIANINGARKCEQIVVGRYVACASRQEEHRTDTMCTTEGEIRTRFARNVKRSTLQRITLVRGVSLLERLEKERKVRARYIAQQTRAHINVEHTYTSTIQIVNSRQLNSFRDKLLSVGIVSYYNRWVLHVRLCHSQRQPAVGHFPFFHRHLCRFGSSAVMLSHTFFLSPLPSNFLCLTFACPRHFI